MILSPQIPESARPHEIVNCLLRAWKWDNSASYRLSVRGRANIGNIGTLGGGGVGIENVDAQGMLLKTYEAAAYREGTIGVPSQSSQSTGSSGPIGSNGPIGSSGPIGSNVINTNTNNGHNNGHGLSTSISKGKGNSIPEFRDFHPHVGCDLLLEYDIHSEVGGDRWQWLGAVQGVQLIQRPTLINTNTNTNFNADLNATGTATGTGVEVVVLERGGQSPYQYSWQYAERFMHTNTNRTDKDGNGEANYEKNTISTISTSRPKQAKQVDVLSVRQVKQFKQMKQVSFDPLEVRPGDPLYEEHHIDEFIRKNTDAPRPLRVEIGSDKLLFG